MHQLNKYHYRQNPEFFFLFKQNKTMMKFASSEK